MSIDVRTMRPIGYAFLCLAFLLAGCSRQEPPAGKGKEKVAVKAKEAAVAKPVEPVMTQLFTKAGQPVPAPFAKRGPRTPEQVKADDESMKKARARMYENAQRWVRTAAEKTVVELEKSTGDLAALEQKIRSESAPAREAFEARQKADAEYETLVGAMPEMQELRAKLEKAKQAFVSQMTKSGQGEQTDPLRDELLAIHGEMVAAEANARKEKADFSRVMEAREAAARAYESELAKNTDFQSLQEKRVELQSQYNGFVARLAELVKQEKQRP